MNSMRKLLLVVSTVMALFFVAACSSEDASKSNEESAAKEEQQKADKLANDQDFEKQLEADKGIEDVMVQLVDGEERKAVNVDIKINKDQKMSADEIIETYGEKIKEQYPDRVIDIIVAQDGKLVKQETIE